MKQSVLSILVLVSVSFANAALLGVENNTDKTVTLGNYRGITLPSICEHTGYSFCWEEAFQKFKPLTKKHKNIQGTILTDLESQEKTLWLEIDGSQTEILIKSCDQYDSAYVQPISGKINFSEIQSVSVCVEGFEATIVID